MRPGGNTTMTFLTLLVVASTSGKLFLVGGGGTPPEIVIRFIEEAGGPNGLIVVMPLPSAEPEKSTGSVSLLERHGAKNLYLFAHSKPEQKHLDELKGKLKDARGVWIPGGVQSRLIERLGKEWVDENLAPLVKKGVNFYGTSAGAMLCSHPMITGPGSEPDTARTGPGMGLTSWLIDTHFGERNREGRLRHAMAATGARKGLGLNEKDWVVIQDDKILEVHGKPMMIELPEPSKTERDGTIFQMLRRRAA
jgi:cyanophycinase